MSSRWPRRWRRRSSCRSTSWSKARLEKVFERIEKEWGQLDFLLHSIAFSPKDALHGRVVDVDREGFLKTMEVSCWSFIRMAHLAEPLMKNGGTHVHHDLLRQPDGREELQHHGRREGGAGGCGALYRGRTRSEGHSRPRHLARPAGDARGVGHSRIRRADGQGAVARRRRAAWSASTMSGWRPRSLRSTAPS